MLGGGQILDTGEFGVFHLECSSETSSPVPDAYTDCGWTTPRGLSFLLTGTDILGRVDPLENELCSQFAEGAF